VNFLPRKLFDGFGNPVFAFSQAEVDSLVENLVAQLKVKQEQVTMLKKDYELLRKELEKTKRQKRRKQVAS